MVKGILKGISKGFITGAFKFPGRKKYKLLSHNGSFKKKY